MVGAESDRVWKLVNAILQMCSKRTRAGAALAVPRRAEYPCP
jgi:hypothetical protein